MIISAGQVCNPCAAPCAAGQIPRWKDCYTMKTTEQTAQKYAKMFVRSLRKAGYQQPELFAAYKARFLQYAESPEYRRFSQFQTMGVDKVFAAITHAKICMEAGIPMEEALRIWETYTAGTIRRIFRGACRAIDLLPNGYRILAGLLYKDAQQRAKEKCLTYEMLSFTEQKLEYKITHCMYIEAFEAFGLRPFCKAVCNSDLCMQAMQKKARFIRYSDLADGDCCHDELVKQ